MPTVARATMLIRSPASSVFNAFVQPALLKKFWLKQAGPLAREPRSTGNSVFLERLKRLKSPVLSEASKSPSYFQMARPLQYGFMPREYRRHP